MDARYKKSKVLLAAIVIYVALASVHRSVAQPATTASSQLSWQPLVVHATTLPVRDERFQSQLNSGLAAAATNNMPERFKALAEWSIRSRVAEMKTDDLIQQTFLAYCQCGREGDRVRQVMLLLFLKDSLSVPAPNLVIALTRYLDFPDAAVRGAALELMDEEGVFAPSMASNEGDFPAINGALSAAPIDPVELPAPLLEAMMNQDTVLAWSNINSHDGEFNRDLSPEYQQHQTELQGEGEMVEQIVFELRDDRYPFDKAAGADVQDLLLKLLASKHWFSRLVVAHIVKHHPRYVSKEIVASLSRDSCQPVRDLAKLISGTPEGSW